ncbi:MAG: MBL fold metallo-hydrolase [Deltaproteobacteria bacterium]|nr:MBL fold metallo-hydrolase [Deltaproteobacteria bacterium]
MRITHIGTATVLLELGALRVLTDPALDPPGRTYHFGFGTRSIKNRAPTLPPEGLGRIDAVLLSHDHHADNLDEAGRAMLPSVARVVTTPSGSKRLAALGNVSGLAPWQSTELERDGVRVKVTATPARHGPPLSRPVAGEVVGFVLESPGLSQGPIYISGDTVWFGGVAEVAQRFRVGTALLHMGGVSFPISGPLRYTFNSDEAVRAAEALGAKTVIPIHYDGWTHFREQRANSERNLEKLGARVRWLKQGEPTELEV